MFYGLSEKMDYFKNKVNLFVALAPITKIPNTQSKSLQFAAYSYRALYDAIDTFGVWEMLPSDWETSSLTKMLCNNLTSFCVYLEEFFATSDPGADDTDRFTVYMDHFPSGTPTQSILLFGQNIREDRFQIFAEDYVKWFGIGEHRQTDLIPL